MTEEKMKKYCRAVARRLELPREIKERVMSDFESAVNARREAGMSEAEILAELGDAKTAARELNEQMKEFAYRKSPWRFVFLAAAVLAGLWLGAYIIVEAVLLVAIGHQVSGGSLGVIGGADGPTAIFVTSSAGFDWDLWIMGLIVVVGIVGFLRLRKCKRK